MRSGDKSADRSSWYMFEVKRGKEVWAQNGMKRVTESVFLPLLRTAKNGGKPHPLFPRHIFVRLDIGNRSVDARYIPGVNSIGYRDDPVQVPDEVIEQLEVLNQTKRSGQPPERDIDEELKNIYDGRLTSMERLVLLLKAIERYRNASS